MDLAQEAVYFAFAGIVLVLVGLAALVVSYHYALDRRLRAQQREAAARLKQIAALIERSRRQDARLSQLQGELRRIHQDFELRELHGGVSGPYVQAIQLARRGGSAAELMAKCDLTLAEAELIARLHRPQVKVQSAAG